MPVTIFFNRVCRSRFRTSFDAKVANYEADEAACNVNQTKDDGRDGGSDHRQTHQEGADDQKGERTLQHGVLSVLEASLAKALR